MRVLFHLALSFLVVFLYQVQVNVAEKCVDKLDNCSALAPQGICNLNKKENVAKAFRCAKTCKLCNTKQEMHMNIVARNRRNSSPKRQVKSTHTHVASRPRHEVRSKQRSKPKNRSHSQRQMRLEKKPNSRVNPRLNQRSNARKSSASKKRVKSNRKASERRAKPKTGPTKPKSAPTKIKPIGPNQIRLSRDDELGIHMMVAKKKSADVCTTFDQLQTKVDVVLQKLNETLQQIELDEKNPALSKIQMDMGHFGIGQIRVKRSRFSGTGGGWTAKADDARGYIQNDYHSSANNIPPNIKDLWNSINNQESLANSNVNSKMMVSHLIAYDVVAQNTSQRRDNLAKTLGSYATDFDKIMNKVSPINGDSGKAQTTLEDAIKEAEANSKNDFQKAKQQVQQVIDVFQKVKREMKKTGTTFKKISDDYGKTADTFNKNRQDAPNVRKPISDELEKFALRCPNKMYVSTVDVSGFICKHTNVSETEYFNLVHMENKFAIEDNIGNYCSDNSNGGQIICDKDKIEMSQLFDKLEQKDGTVVFKCANNKYLNAGDANQPAACTSASIGATELFTLVAEGKK